MSHDPFSGEVPKGGEGGDFELCPAGTHPARITALIDLGHHDKSKSDPKTGKEWVQSTRMLAVVYELSKKDKNGRPFVMAAEITNSMNEKSNLYRIVCGVTGRKFREGEPFNLKESLLGKPVMLAVVHAASKKDADKVYANIGSVGSWIDGFPVPTFLYEPFAWTVDGSAPAPNDEWLPRIFGKIIADVIANSKERGGSSAQAPPVDHREPAATGFTKELAGSNAKPSPAYTPAALALMDVYGIQPHYSIDDLNFIAKEASIPDRVVATLMGFAIPF